MPEISVSALDPRQQKLAENARMAVELGNLDYAIEACADILKACPASVSTRRLQRVALLRRFRSRNRLLARLRAQFLRASMHLRARKAAEEQLHFAGRILMADPTSIAALNSLAEAARRLRWHETTVFALDAVHELRPDDCDNLLALGQAWLDAGRPAEALRIVDTVLDARPVDAVAQDLMRRASVAQTMEQGNWAMVSTPRQPAQAVTVGNSPGDAAEIVTSAAWTRRLIDESLARASEEPGNPTHARRLADGYRRLGQWSQALDWAHKAKAHPESAGDPELEQQAWELEARVLEDRFRTADALLARTPDDQEAQARLQQAGAEWLAFRTAQKIRAVERHPGDVFARLALAIHHLETGGTDLAIEEFQRIESDPQVRVSALIGLGRAFRKKNLIDRAIRHYEAAKQELEPQDQLRSEVIQELGDCRQVADPGTGRPAAAASVHNEPAVVKSAGDQVGASDASR